MPGFKKFKPKTEKELHEIIQNDLDCLEEGLALLKYEFVTGKGVPDFLCIDSGQRLSIIEVKLNEDDNILFQALRYYTEIDKNRFAIASQFHDKKIDPEQHPRIILIAEGFSDDLKRLSSLVKPDVELYEYITLTTPDDKRGIIYKPVQQAIIDEPPSKPMTINNLISYITEETPRRLIEKARDQVKAIGHGIEEYATQGYIGYKYRGRQFAYLRVHRTSFDVGAHIIDEKKQLLDYDQIRVEKDTDDYSEALDKIKLSFENLGGKSTEE